MFAHNLAVWRAQAVADGSPPSPPGRLATALAEVEEGEITWKLRQLAFQRT